MRYALVLILALFCGVTVAGERTSSTFIPTPDHDPEMDVAIGTARNELPRFWLAFQQPRAGDRGFAIKLKFSEGKGWEYMWLDSLERRDGKLFGKIANRPEVVRKLKLGQLIEVNEAEISDWMFVRDGKIHGNYTLRVLLKRMPPSQAEKVRASLAPE